jgi:large subunit ribosomal protein L28
VRLRVTTRALRTVQKVGGIDAFLLGTDDAKLPPEAIVVKRRVRRAIGGVSKPA